MYVLAIDTSNQALGIAIMKGKQVIGELVTNIAKNHSIRLMPAIDQLMKEVNITPNQLAKIVVAKGPGSYTGVRIGLTTAKTLAWALNIPVVGVSSLEALAYQGRFSPTMICPFFDARRGLVYTGLYRWENNHMTVVWEDRNVPLTEWLEQLKVEKASILFLSPDMEKHQEVVQAYMGNQAIIPSEISQNANPVHLALAGNNKPSTPTHRLVPNYLRLAEAEANWLQAQKEQHPNG